MNEIENNPLLEAALNAVLDSIEDTPIETTNESIENNTEPTTSITEPSAIEPNFIVTMDTEVPEEEHTAAVVEETSEEEKITIPDMLAGLNTALAELELVGTASSRRFHNSLWYDTIRSLKISLIGVGGIGSHTAFCLGRLHPDQLSIHDPDVIEEINMAGQLFTFTDIGRLKVHTLADLLHETTHTWVKAFTYRVTQSMRNEFEDTDIMVCGLDNMEARKECWELFKKCPNIKLFIDGRLSLENLQVFCIQRDDTEAYNKYEKTWLFPSSEAIEAPCGAKQTTFTAALIGALITNLIVNYAANQTLAMEVRPLPFYTSYDASFLSLKTEYVCQ